jgi:polysaccharide export outer membrane protein
LVGDVTAAGLTPGDLRKELLNLYSTQLVEKEVTVTVQSSSFPVFITGAVVRPGKVLADHPMTALEAVMEAGGFDFTRANLKSVTVIRNVDGRMEHYKLNFKQVLSGSQSEPFQLRPADIVYVPEKFNWF